MVPASYLYVPGDRPDRFDKALASGAGAVVLDLEDAVAVPAKADARAAVVDHLRAPADGVEQWVRVNAGQPGLADLDAVAALPGLTGVFVPKATRASLDDLAAVAHAVRWIVLIETAATVLDLPGVAAVDGVVALAMGEIDLAADLGVEPSPDEHEMWPFRMQVVAACAAAGPAPIGPVFTGVHDLDGLRDSTAALRRAGFDARQAIHPGQVPVINEVMAPTAEEVERAEALLRLAEAAGGGVCVDEHGRMVDEAVLRHARRTLARLPPP